MMEKKKKRGTIRNPNLRVATNRDCRVAMDIDVNVIELLKLPTRAVTVLARAHDARHGGGAVLKAADPNVKKCEEAGLVVARPYRSLHWIRVTLTTLCKNGHEPSESSKIASRVSEQYCTRCGTRLAVRASS